MKLSFILAALATIRQGAGWVVVSPMRPVVVSSLQAGGVIDLSDTAPRDVATLEDWSAACGVQRAEGFQLVSNNNEFGTTEDISAMTTQDLPAGSPVLLVPNDMILSAQRARDEIGVLKEAEDRLVSVKASDHVPQFYLFLKILQEYQAGTQSPWFPYFNSLPRYYSNGASMTPFCFDCLPPLAGYLAQSERIRYIQYTQALKYVPFLNEQTKTNKALTKWAFAVVYTRGFPTPDGTDFRLVPMADMLNHGTETEVEIQYDAEDNAYAVTTTDVPAGSPLRISYGDPTNPSHLLARYGFLDESSPATFCKIMILRPTQQQLDMGYDHSRMLFYKDTGDVSEEVWDVLLYNNLGATDPDTQQAFYQAHMTGDAATKQSIHEYYFGETAAALQSHIETFLYDLERLKQKGAGKDIREHPRLPLIQAHNEFVKNTFLTVQSKLFEYA